MIATDFESVAEIHVLSNGQIGGYDITVIGSTLHEVEAKQETHVESLRGVEHYVGELRLAASQRAWAVPRTECPRVRDGKLQE